MHRLARLAWSLSSFLLALSCLGFTQQERSSAPGPADAEAAHRYARASRTLLHDLNAHGISFQAMLVFDWSKSLCDNDDATLGFGRYSLDVMMPVDGKSAFGLDGSSGLIRLKHHLQIFGETYDDEAQIYSNIDASSRTTLYEAWFQKSFFSERIRLKAGKMDANTEFAAGSTAADFLNSSMGFSPTILSFPSYPEPKAGLNIFLDRPGTDYVVGGGVFRATAGTMWILEPTRNWKMGPGESGGAPASDIGGSMERLISRMEVRRREQTASTLCWNNPFGTAQKKSNEVCQDFSNLAGQTAEAAG